MNIFKTLTVLSLLAVTACNKTENTTITKPNVVTETDTITLKPLRADEEHVSLG